MRLHQIQIFAAFGMLLAVMAAKATAQINLPCGPENYSHDFQLFAPAEIDLDNQPYRDDYGYWAGYNKLAWSFSGEHVTVGNPDIVTFAEIIYYQNAQDQASLRLLTRFKTACRMRCRTPASASATATRLVTATRATAG